MPRIAKLAVQHTALDLHLPDDVANRLIASIDSLAREVESLRAEVDALTRVVGDVEHTVRNLPDRLEAKVTR